MDFKTFHDGLLSLGCVIFMFSLTFMIGTIVLRPYIGLRITDMYFIEILCIINLFFCIYYVVEATRLEKVFKLEDKHVLRFGKRIGVVSIFYAIHFFIFSSLFLRDVHNIEILLAFLILLLQFLLLGLVFKEVYDLVFLTEAERKYELERDRMRYFKGEGKDLYE